LITIASDISEAELENIINNFVKVNGESPSTRRLKTENPDIPTKHEFYLKKFGKTLRQIIDDTTSLKFNRKPQKYTVENLLSIYFHYREIDKTPSLFNFRLHLNKISGPSITTYINRFKSIENIDKMYGHTNLSKEDVLINHLKKFVNEFGRQPIQKDFEGLQGYPSRRTFTNYFPTFDDALRAAGFDIPRKITYTKEILLAEIHRFVTEHKRQPSIKDMDSFDGYPGKRHFEKSFGSWNNAIKAAGLKEHVSSYSDEELKDRFMNFVRLNGRPPKLHEFNNNPDYPSFWCFQNRYGSWNKTLITYGFDVSVGNSGSHHEFDNGELCKSHYEFDVSNWLRKNKISYLRNVLYSEWIQDYEGKKDCDYLILHNGEIIWLEIAGLYPYREKSSNMELDYKKRFDHKLNNLLSNFNYKVLYPRDFKEKTLNEMFSFLFEIKRPYWLTYEEIYCGVGEEFEVRELEFIK
jgi:hypothetical protein